MKVQFRVVPTDGPALRRLRATTTSSWTFSHLPRLLQSQRQFLSPSGDGPAPLCPSKTLRGEY